MDAGSARTASKDGRLWRIGTADDAAWIAGQTASGLSVDVAIPQVFAAYATFHVPDGIPTTVHERSVVQRLAAHTAAQPWWLGFLETGAHDVVFPTAPRVQLYWGWPYVLVEAGPTQALTWRTGHMRSAYGALPDLFFPADRSWLVSALWDDSWACIGGPGQLLDALGNDPAVRARRVQPGEDALPLGHTRD